MSQDLFIPTRCNVCIMLKYLIPDKGFPNSKLLCFNTKIKCFKCSNCLLIQYCSAEHQKLDWPLHQEICRAIKIIITKKKLSHPLLINGIIKNAEDFDRAIRTLKILLTTILGRNLHYYEEEMTSFPALCNVCFKTKGLHQCPKCEVVSYCSLDHETEDIDAHKPFCNLLKLYYTPYKITPIPNISLNLNKKCDLRDSNIFNIFDCDIISNPELKEDYYLLSTAGNFSCIATICYVLSHCNINEEIQNEFIIFVVGSTNDEIWFNSTQMKFFFSVFPWIQSLKIYFIGPEVTKEPKHKEEYEIQGELYEVQMYKFKGFFEEFAASSIENPSMIVAYNCGFSENLRSLPKISTKVEIENSDETNICGANDTWSCGINRIIQFSEVPIVFTSFTSLEAEADYAAVLRQVDNFNEKSLQIEHIIKTQSNPYKDPRPLRNWKFNEPEKIFYRNGYVQAIRTKVEQKSFQT